MADCESEISEIESAVAILESQMATPEGATDLLLYDKHQKLKTRLDAVMEEWDAASTELDQEKKNMR